MQRLIFQTIWKDNADPDFVEINVRVSNDRIRTNFNCYTSLSKFKKFFEDLSQKILNDDKQILDLNGSEVKNAKITVEKLNSTGTVATILQVKFDEERDTIQAEQVVTLLKFDPVQLDTFCEQIKSFDGTKDDIASLQC